MNTAGHISRLPHQTAAEVSKIVETNERAILADNDRLYKLNREYAGQISNYDAEKRDWEAKSKRDEFEKNVLRDRWSDQIVANIFVTACLFVAIGYAVLVR